MEVRPNSQRDPSYDHKGAPRTDLADLDFTAFVVWRSELERLLHLKVHIYQHICNIYVGICSCRSFLKKAQPYLCKH